MIFDLVKDFAAALAGMPADHPKRRILRLLEEAIRRDVHFIARHPTTLFQCMWNTCWWYDCDEAAQHYQERRAPGSPSPACGRGPGARATKRGLAPRREVPVPSSSGPWSAPGPKLCHLLEGWCDLKHQTRPGFSWIRSHRPPPLHLGTAQMAVFLGHKYSVNSVVFSPNRRRIASGSSDGTIRVWDAESGADVAVMRGHKDVVTSVAYGPDGHRIASGSWDETVRVWDAESGAEVAVLRGHKGYVMSVTYSPDGRRIASGSWDETVRVWDANSGAELRSCADMKTGSRAYSTVQTVGGSPVLAQAGLITRTTIQFGCGTPRPVPRWPSCADMMALSVRHLQPGGPADRQRLYGHTVRRVGRRKRCGTRRLARTRKRCHSVAYSPDGHQIASGSWDKTVRVWDAVSGTELPVLRGHEGRVESVFYSPDGRRIASGSEDNTVRVWDAENSAELSVLRGHEGRIWSVFCSPDRRRIACGGDGVVRVWDTESGAELVVYTRLYRRLQPQRSADR